MNGKELCQWLRSVFGRPWTVAHSEAEQVAVARLDTPAGRTEVYADANRTIEVRVLRYGRAGQRHVPPSAAA